jgi:hypothetical protein
MPVETCDIQRFRCQCNTITLSGEGFPNVLLHSHDLEIIETALPLRKLTLWRGAQGDERLPDLAKTFKKFIAKREPWVRQQVANSTTRPSGSRGKAQK